MTPSCLEPSEVPQSTPSKSRASLFNHRCVPNMPPLQCTPTPRPPCHNPHNPHAIISCHTLRHRRCSLDIAREIGHANKPTCQHTNHSSAPLHSRSTSEDLAPRSSVPCHTRPCRHGTPLPSWPSSPGPCVKQYPTHQYGLIMRKQTILHTHHYTVLLPVRTPVFHQIDLKQLGLQQSLQRTNCAAQSCTARQNSHMSWEIAAMAGYVGVGHTRLTTAAAGSAYRGVVCKLAISPLLSW